jgi:hypothetical protein
MRACRYPLHFTAFYQPAGDIDWREGRTIDISTSGVLIQVDDPLPPGTPIEFRFVLPQAADATTRGEICGRGRVVRTARRPSSSQWCCGVAIEQYELKPGEISTWLDDL